MSQTVSDFRAAQARLSRASRHDGAQLVRKWLAAQSSRLFADWTISAHDINSELEHALKPVRERARELEQNNDLARRYLQLVETHTIGPKGMTLQVAGKMGNGKPDSKNNTIVEQAFAAWGRKGSCEVTGRMSWQDVERLVIRTVARDGECLVRFWRAKYNRESFSIEVIDPQRLDHRKDDGKNIRLGVETNNDGRPVAYWIKRPGARDEQSEKLERVPADQVLYIGRPDRPGQLRCVTWMASAMVTMHMLEKYQESAIVAAREGANKMGFWTTPDGDPAGVGSQDAETGEFAAESEAGIFSVAPAGYSFTSYDPTYPHQLYDDFMRANLRTIAQALNVSYHGLTGDLTQVNYSSIRAGTLEDREYWMVVQDWLKTNLHIPVYTAWLDAAVSNGVISFSGSVNPRERFAAHHWQGRRWQWVDPQKDAAAAISLINARLKSPQRVAAEMGVDVEDVLNEIARFEEMLKEKGLQVTEYELPSEVMNEESDD